MPLDSPEAYERLAEHLNTLDVPLAEWTNARHFTRYLHTGRYPARRFYRYTTVPHVFLDVSLQCSDAGERFDEFRPDLPYSGCLGFFLPRPDRRSKRIILFHHIPFERLQRDLSALLAPADVYLRNTQIADLPEEPEPYRLYFFDHATQTGAFSDGFPWL
jgi:hypothetical protein